MDTTLITALFALGLLFITLLMACCLAAVLWVIRSAAAERTTQTLARVEEAQGRDQAQQELLREMAGELRDAGRDSMHAVEGVVTGMGQILERIANPQMVTNKSDITEAVSAALGNPIVDMGDADAYWAKDEGIMFTDFEGEYPSRDRLGVAPLAPGEGIPGIGVRHTVNAPADTRSNMAGEEYNG